MLRLREVVDGVLHRAETYVIGPIWGYAQRYYLGEFVWAGPAVIVSLFWLFNWIIGSALALAQKPPLPGEPDLRFQPEKSVKSIMKLIVWMGALAVALLLKVSHVAGAWIPAGIIELVVVVTEGIYLLRNLGRIAKALGNNEQSEVLTGVAQSAEAFVDNQVHKKTTTVVTTATTNTEKE